MPTAIQAAGRPATPPVEQFWQRYSPHHEFPLSSATSIALHALILALLALAGWWIVRMGSERSFPLADVPAYYDQGGGGGGPGQGGDGAGGNQPGLQVEDVGPNQQKPDRPDEPPQNRLGQPPIAPPLVPKDDADWQRLVAESEQAQIDLERITKANRDKLRKALQRDGGAGPGGKDKDKGPGKGPGPGGLGTPQERDERLGRWVMVFDTYSGDDYARQLAGLGAYLGIPREDGDDVSYFIIRDLRARPATGKIEDLAEIGRIHWTDAKRESIAPLCRALGIRPIPDHVLAFFPAELERKLLRLELQYEGRREDQIRETRFKIRKTAGGYEPVVIEQIAKKPR
jgi:hypothetical protein